MIDGALPGAMVMATLGMMLGFVTVRRALVGVGIGVLACIAITNTRIAHPYETAALASCWIMIGVTSVFIYFPKLPGHSTTIAVSGFAGVAAGLALSMSGVAFPIHISMLGVLTVIPASLAVRHGYAIAPRVVTSWLLAVAVLAAVMPHVVSHPGYVPDHRE